MRSLRRASALLASACVLAVPAGAQAAGPALPPIKHVWVIVLENKSLPQWFVPGLTTAPYLTQTLPSQGLLVPNYYGVGHSSLDNYIAMVSGQAPAPQTQDDCGDDSYHDMAPYEIRADGQVVDKSPAPHGCVYPAEALTLGDQLTAKGLTWKGYNEGIPEPCSRSGGGTTDPEYKRKHNPWVFFESILQSGTCAANDVGLEPLADDLKSEATTPNFSFIVPNQCDDGHDACDGDNTSLADPNAFLEKWIPVIRASPAYQDGMIIVTFDEGTDPLSCCNEQPGPNSASPGGYGVWPNSGGGQTGQLMLSPYIKAGSVTAESYNHYSLLRSMEDLFGIPEHLGFAGQDGLKPFGADVYNNWAG
jgi:phosphatidylinositol-3-phosphatase